MRVLSSAAVAFALVLGLTGCITINQVAPADSDVAAPLKSDGDIEACETAADAFDGFFEELLAAAKTGSNWETDYVLKEARDRVSGLNYAVSVADNPELVQALEAMSDSMSDFITISLDRVSGGSSSAEGQAASDDLLVAAEDADGICRFEL